MKNSTVTKIIIVGIVVLIGSFFFALTFLGSSDYESAYNTTSANPSLFEDDLQDSILEGVEQNLQKNKDKFIMARVDDGEYLKDIEILKDSFKVNLDVVLSYYEEIEEYEKCSHTLDLINKI